MSLMDTEKETIINESEQFAERIRDYAERLFDWLLSKAGSVLLAIIFLVVCFRLVKWLTKILKRTFDRSKLDESVAGFFLSAIRILLNCLVLITAATIMGFQMTSFITLLGTAGVAVGLALQGSLSNLAGGVLILILKPFKIGDYIIENSTKCEGTVVSIDIFYTKLVTADGKSVVIPNGAISNTSLINVSEQKIRRVDIEFSVGYDADLEKVKCIVTDTVKKIDGFLSDEPVDLYIEAYESSSIQMFVRFRVKNEKYFDAKWTAMWEIKSAFDANGIVIPYNKLDVNMNHKDIERLGVNESDKN